MKLSIVTTLYQSAAYVNEFHRRVSLVTRQLVQEDYEIILVNDGSPDNSLQVAVGLTEKDPHVLVVDLSRNFGHHKAIMTGLSEARGERVFLIDCDLEEPPEIVAGWWNRLEADPDLDVVYGVQPSRKGNWFERISGSLFYCLLNAISPVKIPENVLTARLMTKRYVQALVQHRDREIFLLGLWCITGFKQEAEVVTKGSKGSSAYTLRRRFSLFFNAITGFSNYPLYIVFGLGLFISLLGFLYAGYLVVFRLLHPNWVLSGWTSVIASVWIMCGLILSAQGVLGVYLAKVFSEVKPRPYTTVRRIYGKQ
ncbi:MAG TPA: glycosyltransferase family 2 protein [Candidatus Sumerlaeota bacterium]|nr:glycosyltransferase family 2 protein [Candidatus Sumerlaeota bacterium]